MGEICPQPARAKLGSGLAAALLRLFYRTFDGWQVVVAVVVEVFEAVRSRVSIPVLLRMAGNMLANTVFDYLPALGPVASAFFKSNIRNLRLLQDWQAGQHEIVKRSTWRLFAVLGLIMVALAGMLFGLFALYVWLLTHLFRA